MAELSDKARRGAKVIEEMMGPAFARKLSEVAASDGFGATMSGMALEFAFADVWGRAGLSRREKSLVVIGILIAQRQTAELGNHVKIGVANGLGVGDFENILIQAAPYVGFPAAASAGTAIVQALREADLDPATRTAEERGSL